MIFIGQKPRGSSFHLSLLWLGALSIIGIGTWNPHLALGAESSPDVAAARMDLQTHTALIDKLHDVLPKLPPHSPQTVTIKVRLGDVFAERARLKDITAGEKNCTDCQQATQDRRQAIKYYLMAKSSLIKTTSPKEIDELQRINLQLANLYRVTDKNTQSRQIYVEILKDPRQKKIHSKAHFGIAEMNFSRGQYQEALREYQAALNGSTTEEKIAITFRQAWCNYNLGRNQLALRLIQNAIVQARDLSLASFHKDLMHDYATMLARNSFTDRDLGRFLQLSPETEKIENLQFFADEAERMGNKRGSLLILALLLKQDSSQQNNADIQLKIAQNYYDLNNYPQCIQHLDQASRFLGAKSCIDCEKVKKDFKNLLVTWNKKESLSPSVNLVLAFQKYIDAQPDDYEVIIWAAQVARQRKDNGKAYELYERAAEVAAKQNHPRDLESSLVIAIEIAEKSSIKGLYERSLKKYLELNPKGPLAYTARYQLAYLLYKENQYAKAFASFKDLALDKKATDKKLQLQSAELSLDSLKILKQDEEIRDLSGTYSQLFPQRANHFSEIGRKVTINLLIAAIKVEPVNKSTIQREIKKLNSYSVQTLPPEDQSTHWRTLILGCEKVEDFKTIEFASQKILALKHPIRQDTELARKSLLWVYELRLDFKNAYLTAMQMKMENLSPPQRSLRRGLLAELAGRDPAPHFNDYLRSSPSIRSANQIRLKLIRHSQNKWKSYQKMFSPLVATPDLLAQITLELHLLKTNPTQVKRALSARGVANTPEGNYLRGLQIRQDFAQLARQTHRQRLVTSSDRRLQKSIKERMGLLNQVKSAYNQANQNGDLFLQINSLQTVNAENRRFYQQLIGLPVPRGLSAKERTTYRQLLNDRAAPFLLAAQEAENLLKQFFKIQEGAIDKLRLSITSEDPIARSVAINEYNLLKRYLPSTVAQQFKSELQKLNVRSSQVAQIRREVEKNPMDPASLQELRELEAKRANGPLLAYLDERLSQMKSERRR